MVSEIYVADLAKYIGPYTCMGSYLNVHIRVWSVHLHVSIHTCALVHMYMCTKRMGPYVHVSNIYFRSCANRQLQDRIILYSGCDVTKTLRRSPLLSLALYWAPQRYNLVAQYKS